MKTLIKIAVLGIAFAGLTACSSSQKEEDSVLADMAKADTAIESTEESTDSEATVSNDSTEPTELYDTKGSFDQEDNSSLGTGSSGLGH